MKDSDPGRHEAILKYGEPRQLQTDYEFMQWRFWQQNLDPATIPPDLVRSNEEFYKLQLSKSGYIGSGLFRKSSAIFAFFDRGQIISAGSVTATTSDEWDLHTPKGSKYARIDNGKTLPAYCGIGLNTHITNARIKWAQQNGLSCVETTIKPDNFGSIKAKLKAGFVIDTFDHDVGVLYPLTNDARSFRGISNQYADDGDTILISGLHHLHYRLRSHFAVLGDQSVDQPDLFFIRMIPRVSEVPTEI